MNGIGVTDRWVWPLRVALVLAAGLLLARLGPFGTFSDLPAASRVAYWIGLTLLMWLQSLAAVAVLGRLRLPPAVRLLLAALIGAVPTAFEVAWAEMLLRVERDLGLIDVVQIFGDVALLSVPLLLATQLVIRRDAPTVDAAEPGADEGSGTDWLLAKVRPERRGRLLALESDDHYVRVRTTSGDELLHMRFGDAVARLGPERGCRVHRSWWVASGAVRAQKREGDRIIVELLDGTEVPVSRSYAVAAREAGLITPG